MSQRPERVPKRQFAHIDSELDIYIRHAGGGINRKPYTTDEFQLFKEDLEADEEDED